MDPIIPIAHALARGIELVGLGILVLGLVAASVGFVRKVLSSEPFDTVFHWYRTQLGRAILLGLEFLVAGDIIDTVTVQPTLEKVGALGLIVLIRTFLSFSLEVEINGSLPWRGGEGGRTASL